MLALSAMLFTLFGCPKGEPLELRDLSIDPDPARAGSILNIEFVASHVPSEAPLVTVAGETAEPVGYTGAEEEATRYIYNYDVTGEEPEGSVNVSAIAVDARGEEVSIEQTVVFDFTPPTVTGLTGPDDPTSETSATFTFGCSEDGCVFTCSLEAEAEGSIAAQEQCDSGITYQGLANDTYTFAVRATDPAGNEGEPATWSWTVEASEQPAASFEVSGIPSPIAAGTAADLTIEALDAQSDRATGYVGTVSFASSDAQAELPSDYTFTAADAGIVTLTGAIELRSAGVQSVTVTDTASTTVTGSQADIEVQPAAAARLAFVVQPSDVMEGAPIAPPVEVEIRDAFDNLIPGATNTVTLTLQGGVPGAILTGATEEAAGGVAVFSNLSVSAAGTDYSLLAAASDLTSGTSATFAVLDGPEIELVFPGRTWPANPLDLEVEVLGVAFTAGVRVIWDAGGNEEEITPTNVEASRLEVTLTSDLWEGRTGEVPIAIDLDGARSNTFPFVIGGVLPDTGQTSCYDESEAFHACPASGDFHGQDAQYGWDLDIEPQERFSLAGTDSNPIVVDNVTQLRWQGCVAGRSGSDCHDDTASAMTWHDALDYCAQLSWGGVTPGPNGWRLPTAKELFTILDRGRTEEPRIDLTTFPETPANWQWSSSSCVHDTSRAWDVSFKCGPVGGCGGSKTLSRPVRCVHGDGPETQFHRSEPEPSQHAGEWVVRDIGNGLMWQGCSAGQTGEDCTSAAELTMTWKDALSYCIDSDWGGYTDWRLPDVNELQGIVDYDSSSPAIDPAVFPGSPQVFYWSSSSQASNPAYAWTVDFDRGFVLFAPGGDDKSGTNHVRCVRGGIGP